MIYVLYLVACTAQWGCAEMQWPLYGDPRFENDPAPFRDEQTCINWGNSIDKAMRDNAKGWVEKGSIRCDMIMEIPNG